MIEWRVEMAVGVPSIDEDHKVLINIINEFECCQTLVCAEKTAKKLFNYTKSHFKREENAAFRQLPQPKSTFMWIEPC